MPSHLESSPGAAGDAGQGISAAPGRGGRPRPRTPALPLRAPPRAGWETPWDSPCTAGAGVQTSAPAESTWGLPSPNLPAHCGAHPQPRRALITPLVGLGVALQSKVLWQDTGFTNLIFPLFLIPRAAGEPGAGSLHVPSLAGTSPASQARRSHAPPRLPQLLPKHSRGDEVPC